MLYALSGLVGVGQNPTAYSKVLAAYFDRRRGLAMGLALAGVGLGTALMPALSARLIEHVGWRTTYACLGAVILVLAFLPVLFWLPEPPRRAAQAATTVLPGLTVFAEAIRSRGYWTLAIAFFLTTVAINGALVHVVPLLTDRGMTTSAAAGTIAAAGMALIAGRVAAGYVMDRVFAPYVAMASLLGPMAGLAILGWNALSLSPFVATALLGLGIGVEVDLMSFLVTRYFGLRAFGALHGLMFAALVLGNAVGASALGWSFQLLQLVPAGIRRARAFAARGHGAVRHARTVSLSAGPRSLRSAGRRASCRTTNARETITGLVERRVRRTDSVDHGCVHRRDHRPDQRTSGRSHASPSARPRICSAFDASLPRHATCWSGRTSTSSAPYRSRRCGHAARSTAVIETPRRAAAATNGAVRGAEADDRELRAKQVINRSAFGRATHAEGARQDARSA